MLPHGHLKVTFNYNSLIEANQWTHVAVTWNRERRTASLLVNDNKETLQVSVDAIDLPLMTRKFFKIGKVGEIRYYKGYIRDVKLFEKALSETEVKLIKGLRDFQCFVFLCAFFFSYF